MAEDDSKRDYLNAGELARLAGVSTDTLRHYERKGVLSAPRRSHNNYRHYPQESLERVRLVRRALAVGFTLDELASILAAREKGGAPCQDVKSLALEKLRQVEVRLVELKLLRDELRSTLEDWEIRLAETPSGDTVSADKIRKHLSHIALMFSDGNFNTPMMIHGEMPPGVPVMQRLKVEIDYKFERTGRGGRIRIKTSNAEALKAIHEFFRFQVIEHKTGDSLEVAGAH